MHTSIIWRVASCLSSFLRFLMAFLPPSFPLMVNLWRRPALAAGLPTRSFRANLSVGRRALVTNPGANASGAELSWPSELMCPALTDIAGPAGINFLDLVEIPAGSGRYYAVWHVEDVGKGFSNEYRLAIVMQLQTAVMTVTTNPWAAPPWPVPTP